MNWLNLDYDKASIIIGALCGLLIVVVIWLAVFGLCLHALWKEKRSGGVGGVAGGIGFIIFPAFILTGMPWSSLSCLIEILVPTSNWMFNLALIGIINGNLLNGALIGASFGALFGLINKFLW